MPILRIDGNEVQVPDGTSVLEAAQIAGIVIPHFCWHPALGKAGACRVCAVKLLEGPVKGIQMSCMLPAQDGMVVSTTDDEAVSLRASVIEWLMINHPHDCPVCDEGGECQLQDFTIAGGHGIRRYDGLKRTHRNQFLGDFIDHEMNRCIQCYRCARFYQEYAGGNDFGVLGRAGMVYFGRQRDGRLESPFSGNLVDICPTGVFTDKTARFRARYWDYDMAPSVCPHCSLGCNTIPMARYRELLKVTARRNDAVNGWFICDRGRFGNSSVNAPERPRQALVDGEPVSTDQALDALAERLSEFLTLHGPAGLAIIASPRMSLEGNIMAARLHGLLDSGALCYFGDALSAQSALETAALRSTDATASQDDVRRADLVAVMACNLLDVAPMMALAVRQAWREGARVYLLGDDLPGDGLPFEFERTTSLADIPFNQAIRPVIIRGPGHNAWEWPATTLDDAKVKLVNLQEGPNACGCAILAHQHGAVPFSTAIASGRIRGIISFEADLPENLLENITVIAAADWHTTPLTRRARVFLPTSAWVEQSGTFVNYEGRAQRFNQVMSPGLPISGLDPADHPPRRHGTEAPGGDLAPSGRLIAALMRRMGDERVDEPLNGAWAELRELDAESPGRLLTGRAATV